MFRDLPQASDVSLNELRRAVVVVHDRHYAVRHAMVGLARADVDGEKGVYYCVEEEVEGRLDALANA